MFEFQMTRRKRQFLLLGIITAVGASLRFYNLDWGSGWFFHPDERNILYAISRLDVTSGKLNPKFWAYGSFPIYLTYFINWTLSQFTHAQLLEFTNFALTGRFLSAAASTLVIPITYFLTCAALSNHSSRWPLLTALWIALLPGMIQFAHFMTFESLLTLEYLLLFYACLKLAQHGSPKWYLLISLLFGLSLSVKLTSLVFLPLILLADLIYRYNLKPTRPLIKLLLQIFSPKLFVLLLYAGAVFVFTSPYHLIDIDGLQGSLNYEGALARGELIVFYSQQFANTVPGLYQLVRVFPYILTLPLTLLSLSALVYLTCSSIREAWRSYKRQTELSPPTTFTLLLLTAVFGYLGFHLSLFVKWTRYMVPMLPFLAIISILFLRALHKESIIHSRSWTNYGLRLLPVLTGLIVLQGLNFFSIYLQPDPRIKAADWANKNIPPNSKILSETYDLGITPFNAKLPASSIKLYNIYNIDNPKATESARELYQLAKSADYFISPSQRIRTTRLRLCARYSKACQFYQDLLNNELGYQQVASFKRKPFLTLPFVYTFSDPKLAADETFTVFDNPTVLIFKNTQKP